MEILFLNEYSDNKKGVIEFYKKRISTKILNILIFIMVFMILFSIQLMFLVNSTAIFFDLMEIVGRIGILNIFSAYIFALAEATINSFKVYFRISYLCLILFAFSLPYINAYTSELQFRYMATKSLKKSEISAKVEFSDEIALSSGLFNLKVKYEDIKKVVYLDNVIVIYTKNRKFPVFFLAYDGFTKGSFKEFKVFIKEKCNNIEVI